MRVTSEQDANEQKGRMREQAFLGWLMYLMQPTGMKRKVSYKEWLKNLGLSEKGEKPENLEELRNKALKIADDIIKMDKGRHK